MHSSILQKRYMLQFSLTCGLYLQHLEEYSTWDVIRIFRTCQRQTILWQKSKYVFCHDVRCLKVFSLFLFIKKSNLIWVKIQTSLIFLVALRCFHFNNTVIICVCLSVHARTFVYINTLNEKFQIWYFLNFLGLLYAQTFFVLIKRIGHIILLPPILQYYNYLASLHTFMWLWSVAIHALALAKRYLTNLCQLHLDV